MKTRVISVGKIREPFYQAGIKEYIKRLGPYTGVELLSGFEEKAPTRPDRHDIEMVKFKEGQRILRLLAPEDYVVLCDIEGQKVSSPELAARVQEWMNSSKTRINMVIGGAYGVSAEVRGVARERISLSKLTFPHQMAVLILFEQLYRAFKIIRREPYHH